MPFLLRARVCVAEGERVNKGVKKAITSYEGKQRGSLRFPVTFGAGKSNAYPFVCLFDALPITRL